MSVQPRERKDMLDNQKSSPHGSVLFCGNSSCHEELPLSFVHKSVSKRAQLRFLLRITLPWEVTSGLWMATSGAGSSKGTSLTSTEIPVWSQHTSRFATHSPPPFCTVPKRKSISFSPQATWPWKNHCFSLFECIQLLFCQLQCILYSSRKRWTWKKSMGCFLVHAHCTERNVDYFPSF